MIKVKWYKNMAVVEKRMNIYRLWDQKLDKYERTITFEGPQTYSHKGTLSSHSDFLVSRDRRPHAEHLECFGKTPQVHKLGQVLSEVHDHLLQIQ